MGVFKKLKGDDVRITPIRVMFPGGTDSNVNIAAVNKNKAGKNSRSDFSHTDTGTSNSSLVYNSIRQLFYGAFLTQNFTRTGSAFESSVNGTLEAKAQGEFSRFNPSFQGSLAYQRTGLSITEDLAHKVYSIPTKNFGESIAPGTFSATYGSIAITDDSNGNLVNAANAIQGNIFYDQGIAIALGGSTFSAVSFSGSYTIYQSQYKCTTGPDEFNLSMNPSLGETATDYNLSIVDSPEFMPFVTTIGLYNENQDLLAVAKLSNPVQLNSYADTNFIVRLDL